MRGADGSLWSRAAADGMGPPLLLILVLPLLLASSRILSTVLCTYMGGLLPGGCITSVLLWEEEWPVFVLPVCRPLAQ